MNNMDRKLCVYLADVTPLNDTNIFNKLYDQVSDLRKKKTDELKFFNDKILSLGSEYLLMIACKDFGIEYEKEELIVDSFSKPCFFNKNVYFNISHSVEKVMCIMSYNQVGCDIEKIRPINMDLPKRYFTNLEYQAINKSENKESEFFKYWTLKESYIKCTGIGLSMPLKSFEIKIDGGNITLYKDGNKELYSFKNFQNQGYSYSWCMKDDIPYEDVNVNIKTIEI